MFRKIVLLISIILLLGLAGNASAVLKGWWRLNEGSGSTAADSSGNGYNGTITGAAWLNDGTRGYVLDFEGADYIAIPSAAVSLTTTVTVALWQYGDVALQPETNNIFEGTRSSNRTLSAHVPWSNGHIIWDAGYASTFDRVDKNADSANQYEGQWNHWAFTKDTSAGQMKIYLNGTLWSSGTGKTKSMSGINLFKIGAKADGTQNYDGMISDFRVYNTVLSDTEIKVLAGWTRTIAGTVGTVDGVTMGGLPGSPVTSGGGAYTATVQYGWSGTATPTKTGYTFSPTNKTYSNVTANQTAQNYTPTQLTYTISGTVGTLNGVSMGGLPVEIITSGGGAYSATVDYGWTGTVTPEKEGYTFSPTNKTYSNVTSNKTAQNYTPTLVTYTISGHVGTLDGVTMNGLPGNPSTSGGGAYSVTVTTTWSGTVTPAKTGYTFDPASRMYSNVGANLTEDYTPTLNTYIISGNVGTVIGVTMSGLPGNPVSTAGGAYSATVTHGWSGTATPTKSAHYTFTPTTKTYSNVTSDRADQNYTVTTSIGDPNLVGWWLFSGNANDYSGYGNNGTVTGASYVSSDIGTVLDFEGADYVSIPSSTFATIHDKVTIALWQYGDVALQPQNCNIFEGTKNGSNRVLSSHLPWGTGSVYFDAGYAGTTYDRINKAATADQYEGQWNHWVFTKDTAANQMKIYLNGALWHSGTGKSKSMSGITQFKIGSAADGTFNYDGMICEFKIYDKTMSATEVDALYHASYEALEPSPADGTVDVATSADISWTAGYLAGEHDVYFGTNAALVTNRDQAAFKGSQGGTSYDPGTLAAGMTYYWAVDEVNDYYENSPWLGDVYSFTTVGSGTTCPLCGGQGECDLHIQNYNPRLGGISGIQKVNCIRVTEDGKQTGSLSSIKSAVNSYSNFVEHASYGRLKLVIGVSKTYNVAPGTKIENKLVAYCNTLPNALMNVILKPVNSGGSHAGGDHVWLSALRSLRHEAGHIIGLGHSNSNINGDFDSYGDASSIMSAYPSLNYAVNQQHWLGWLNDSRVFKINDCIDKMGSVDVTLMPVASGGATSDIPYTCVYEIPDSDQRIWVSIPKAIDSNLNGIKGGEIFIYRSSKQQGCTGICMNSVSIGRIGNPKTAEPRDIEGLIVDPIAWEGTTEQFDGHNVTRFSQITVRLSLAEQPPVVDPNDYNDPTVEPIANWEFLEGSGTVLRNTINDGTTGPATWTANRTGITTTGDETLLFRPTTNTINGSVTYFDLVGAVNEITSGKAWTVVEINDFNFIGGTAGERLRFGMTQTMANGSLTAEFILRRVASNSIHLMGFGSGTMPSTGVQIYASNTFAGLLEICTEYDFDARTFQIFYRFDGTGEWTSIGAAAALNGSNVGNALRLCAGDSASAGTGSWDGTGEYLHIGRIYLTRGNPMIELPNQNPTVSMTYPNDDDTFTPGSNITLQAVADDIDGSVSTVNFYRNGTTLIGQGQIPAVQNDIVNAAGDATIHGATAQYQPVDDSIGYWSNVNDWLSWTATVVRTGTFEVWVNYACKNSSAGATYRVDVGDQYVQGTVVGTDSDDWSTYDSVYLGTVDIAQTGTVDVNVVPETKPNSYVMNLRDVTLIPADLDDCYEYTWSNVSAGTYTLTAKATDDEAAETVSDPIVIHVQQ